jgi:hypothetical protein
MWLAGPFSRDGLFWLRLPLTDLEGKLLFVGRIVEINGADFDSIKRRLECSRPRWKYREPRSEKSDCDLQLRCNALISLGLKAAQFTAKYLKHHVKRQTLNHRVPGSSPGAPTKLFKGLAAIRGIHSDKLWSVIPTKRLALFARHGVFGRRKRAASGSASRTSATAAPTGGVLLRAVPHRRDRSPLLP